MFWELRSYGFAVYSNCPTCGEEIRIGGYRGSPTKSFIAKLWKKYADKLESMCQQLRVIH